jgi:hypothetical protein
MTTFVSSLISRINKTDGGIQPRLRGKFERDTHSPAFIPEQEGDTGLVVGPAPAVQDKEPAIKSRIPGIASELNAPSNAAARQAQQEGSPEPSTSVPSWSIRQVNRAHFREQKLQGAEPDYKRMPLPPVSESPFGKSRKIAGGEVTTEGYSGKFSQELHSGNAGGAAGQPAQIRPEQAFPGSSVLLVDLPVAERDQQRPAVKPSSGYQAGSVPAPGKENLKNTGLRFMNAEAKQTGEPSQTINISIGRVEVRVSPPAAQMQPKQKKEGLAIMTLDEYLSKRNQGKYEQ